MSLRWLLVASLLRCASPQPAPTPPEQKVPEQKVPLLLGQPGESQEHFFSRVIASICVGDDREELVAQVQDFIGACLNSGREMPVCQVAACEKLHEAKNRWACPAYKVRSL